MPRPPGSKNTRTIIYELRATNAQLQAALDMAHGKLRDLLAQREREHAERARENEREDDAARAAYFSARAQRRR